LSGKGESPPRRPPSRHW